MDKIFEEMKEIYDNKTVCEKEWEEIEENPNCKKESCGSSGKDPNLKMYIVYEYDFKKDLKLGGEFTIYTK